MKHLRILAFLVATSTAFGAESHRNGTWWLEQSPTIQLSYITGVFDGVNVGIRFSGGAFLDNSMESPGKALIAFYGSCEKITHKYLAHVSSDQLADGLTAFYKDYRNRSIGISDAIWLVLNIISGKSDTEMQPMIEDSRKSP